MLATAAGLAIAGVGVGALVLRGTDSVPSLRHEYCSADVGGTYAELDLEQARYASLIAATGTRRGLPARASSIAIATAYQESKVRNLDYGDRDSVGLFQQRPSQGWGSRRQIMDPHYAIASFFSGLVKVEGYRAMEITEAAQEVQRSAYGGAYAQHEPYARALASALSGYSRAAFTCQIRTPETAPPKRFRRDVHGAFGDLPHRNVEHGTDYPAPSRRKGWAVAQYVVANAKRLGVSSVEYDGRRWTAQDSPDGWVATAAHRGGTVRVRTE